MRQSRKPFLFYLVTQHTHGKDPYGAYLNDANHRKIPNSEGIYQGDSGIRGSFIIPVPNKKNEYYLFTIPTLDTYKNNNVIDTVFTNIYAANIFYNKDTSFILRKNILIYHGCMAFHPQVVRHADGINWWIIGYDISTNTFISFLLEGTENIISEKYISKNIYNINEKVINGFNNSFAMSQDGSFLSLGSFYGDKLAIFDFDRCSGTINIRHEFKSNPLSQTAYFYHVFSKENNNLYYKVDDKIENSGDFLYQCNLNDKNYPICTLLHGYHTGLGGFGRLAPDNKIYNTIFGYELRDKDTSQKYLAVIENPVNWGIKAGLNYHGIYLRGKNSDSFLPYFPNYHLRPLFITDVAKTHFSAETLRACVSSRPILGTVHRPNVRYRWSPALYLSSDTIATPVFTPPATGIYQYHLTVTGLEGSCWENEIATDDITIIIDNDVPDCIPTGVDKPITPKEPKTF